MKRKVFSLLLFLAAAAVVLMTFVFSSQDGETSSGLSREVSRFLAERASPGWWRKNGTAAGEQVLDFLSHPVRKAAHFTEYAALGMLLMGGFMLLRFSMSLRMLFSLLIGAAAAFADEYHQRFVFGRGGTLSDVLLDVSGVLCGILTVAVICMAGMYLIGHRRLKKSAKRRSGDASRYRAAPPPGGASGRDF